MVKIQVFDPPMCCSSGNCGPDVDPKLARFAADLEWLEGQGPSIERYSLSQSPGAFTDDAVVAAAMARHPDCLPLLLVNGRLAWEGSYPPRETLAGLAGVAAPPSLFTDAVKELVALGAAIASNCEGCFRFHYGMARKLGVSRHDMALAVATARSVKETPARAVLELAEKYLEGGLDHLEAPKSCCEQVGEVKPGCGPKQPSTAPAQPR